MVPPISREGLSLLLNLIRKLYIQKYGSPILWVFFDPFKLLAKPTIAGFQYTPEIQHSSSCVIFFLVSQILQTLLSILNSLLFFFFFLICFSGVVTKHQLKPAGYGKGLFNYTDYSLSPSKEERQELRKEPQRNITCQLTLNLISEGQDHLSRGCTAQDGLDPPISVTNQRNAPTDLPTSQCDGDLN